MANEDKNVLHSYYVRANTQLSGETLVFHPYTDMSKRSDTDFIVVYSPVKLARPSRLGSRIEEWFFEMNAFAKLTTQNMYKVHELGDSIGTAFDQVTFSLQDFETVGDPVIGYIRCSEVEKRDVLNPANPELHQLNCSFTGFLAI